MSTKETKHKENEETVTENPQTASETQSADANRQTSKEQTAEERIAALEAENADLQDKYLRKSADFENYRKRMVKEKQEIFDYANANLLTDLIGILDDFDRALAARHRDDRCLAGVVLSVCSKKVSGLTVILPPKNAL